MKGNKFNPRFRVVKFRSANIIISRMPECDCLRLRMYYKHLMASHTIDIVNDDKYMKNLIYDFVRYYKEQLRDQ